jgi:hypothetical protein
MSVAWSYFCCNLHLLCSQIDKDQKFFSPSPIAQKLQQQQQKQQTVNAASLSPPLRQKSIVTLSSHSSLSTPLNMSEEKDLIATNTRNIAKLAAKRRTTKVQQNYNSLDRYDYGDAASNHTDISMLMDKGAHLTESRLALHDKKFGSSLTLANDEQRSVLTDNQVQDRSKNNKIRMLGKDVRGKNPQAKYNQVRFNHHFIHVLFAVCLLDNTLY